MTANELFQATIKQMLVDWTEATPEQRAEALRLAALSATAADETYYVAGIGWCGHGWEAKADAERGRCHFGECGAPRCTGCGVQLKGGR
jgi:hypothetical protein